MHVRGEGGPPVLASVYTRVMLRAQVRVYGRLALNSVILLVDINEYLSITINMNGRSIIDNGDMCMWGIPASIYMCNVWVYLTRTPSCVLWI